MSRELNPLTGLERQLAQLLHYGTWLASAVIGLGLLWQLIDPRGLGLVNVGIGLFIALPVLRVACMLMMFLRERDYRFSFIAAAVLGIIACGLLAGLRFH